VAVHEDAAVAQQMYERYIRGYSRSALEHYEFHNEGLADIKGYEYYGALAQKIRKYGMDSFVDFLASLQIWGTPDVVYERIVEARARADAAAWVGIFSYGGMPYDMARANMTLFAEKVLPRLKALPGGDIGLGAPLAIAAE